MSVAWKQQRETGGCSPACLWLLPVTNFIMKAFINGRKLFGTPFYPVPSTEVVSLP